MRTQRAVVGTHGRALRMGVLLIAVIVGTACSTVRIVHDKTTGLYQPKKAWRAADFLEGLQGEVVTFKNVSGDTIKLRFDKCCVETPFTLDLADGEKGDVTLRTTLPGPGEDCPQCACQCCNYVIDGPQGGHGAPTMIVKKGP
jgi:hypothetical protein